MIFSESYTVRTRNEPGMACFCDYPDRDRRDDVVCLGSFPHQKGVIGMDSVFYDYRCGLCRFTTDSLAALEDHGFMRHCKRKFDGDIGRWDEIPTYSLPIVIDGIGESRLQIPIRKGK